MSTVTQICDALIARLQHLPGVDQTSRDTYLPAIESEYISLIIPPLGQQTQVYTLTARRTPVFQSHRIRCEFWIKLDSGNMAQALERAREIGMWAIRDLLAEPTLGGVVQSVGHFGPGSNQMSIECDVAETPIKAGNVPYLVTTVIVPVIDYADA
jgi:hypothetical protein